MRLPHTRWAAIPLAIVLAIALHATFANAASGSRTDENDATGFDIKEITFSDTNEVCEEGGSAVECITYGLEAYDAFSTSDPGLANIVWDLDLTGNGVFQEGLDGCFRIARAGALRVTLFDDGCGQTSRNVYTATTTDNKLTFKVPKTDLEFGLQTRTKYGMRIAAGTAATDVVPDAGADPLEHCLGATACAGSTTPPGTTAPGTTAPGTTAPGTTAPATTPPGSTAPPALSTTACIGLPTATPTASPTTSPALSPTATPTASPTASPTATPTGSPAATSAADTTGTGTQSKNTAAPGDSVTISGTGFKPSSPLVMTLCSTPLSLGSSTSTSTGSFSATISIPTNATLGAHTIVVEGPKPTTGTHRLRFPITVAVASTGGTNNSLGSTSGTTTTGGSASDPSKLPSTGSPIMVLAIAGLALMLIGGAAIDSAATLKRRKLAVPETSPTSSKVSAGGPLWGAVGDPTAYEV